MKTYTGYKRYQIFIKKVRDKFRITSNDHHFEEYYLDSTKLYSTYDEALTELKKVREKHNLERFDTLNERRD